MAYTADVFFLPGAWLACSLIVLSLFVFRRYTSSSGLRRRAEPPGPWGLPIVGYLPFLGRKMNLAINRLAKRYGNVFQLRIGSRKIVVISGQKSIRTALVDNATTFAGRPDFYSYSLVPGYGFADFSPSYRVYKKHTLKALHQFTKVRREELQQVAHNAVRILLKEFKVSKNQPMDPEAVLTKAVCTIVGYICYGEFFDADSEMVTRILSQKDVSRYIGFGVICDFLPWAKFLFRNQLQKLEESFRKGTNFSNELAQAHIEDYDEEVMRDACDMFRKAAKNMDEDERKLLKVDDDVLKEHVFTLFGAGFGPTTYCLRYAIMIMALNPKIQTRVQEEIDSVVSRDHFPEFDNERSLPYTVATITEIFRYHSQAALAITHSTTCDTEFGGYFIPKKTPVIVNLHSANYDESIFSNPEKFDPNRFLNDDGTLDKSLASCVVPFGLGQRRCTGEAVVRLEIFVFFATILQQCTIEQAPGHPLDLDNYFMGLAITHLPFKVTFRSRNGDW